MHFTEIMPYEILYCTELAYDYEKQKVLTIRQSYATLIQLALGRLRQQLQLQCTLNNKHHLLVFTQNTEHNGAGAAREFEKVNTANGKTIGLVAIAVLHVVNK